jgi:hypothetical protein
MCGKSVNVPFFSISSDWRRLIRRHTMNENGTTENTGTFQIGLVLAGAVSAGAYSAGVIDFLIEAADRWYQARQDEESRNVPPEQRKVPGHDVCLRTMAGASAGSMVAALAAVALNAPRYAVDPDHPTADTKNRLYSSWVVKADIGSMLTTTDLPEKDSPLISLLDASFLEGLAAGAIAADQPYEPRPYVADRLPLFISVTNLRGVPYSIDFQGTQVIGHGMSNHADYLRFDVVKPGAASTGGPETGGLRLNPEPRDQQEKDDWKKLARAAIASGAFPIALSPRSLVRDTKDYEERRWTIPFAEVKTVNGIPVCSGRETIPPAWDGNRPDEYTFLAVDGGVMNNEPMEYARQELAGPGLRNERRGDRASRAVLMIDPFPDTVSFEREYKEDPGLTAVAGAIFKSLMAQAGFKADDLKLSRDPNVFSRFVIVPTREKSDRETDKGKWPALASHSLAHFGGFLDEAFRRHDFILGRRNCQRFLQKYFVLPKENPLFARWPRALKEAGSPYLQTRTIDGKEVECLPVIPLVDDLAAEIKQPSWPAIPEARLKALEAKLGVRVKTVLNRLAAGLYAPGQAPAGAPAQKKSFLSRVLLFALKPLLWLFLRWLTGWIKRKMMKIISDNLTAAELLVRE